MSSKINIVRYSVMLAIVVLLVVLGVVYHINPFLMILVVLLLLFACNIVDDYLFYYGYTKLDLSKYKGGIGCPVNGIVTAIDKDVPLFSHLEKVDCLTKDVIVEKFGIKFSDDKYTHITIFLNKFNAHSVANIGSKIRNVVQFDMNGTSYPMVEDGELVANNSGLYLTNTFVDIEYENGVHSILTMDKYISLAVPITENEMFDYFICKGSQCDIYLPKGYHLDIKENSKVDLFQTIAHTDNVQFLYNSKNTANNLKEVIPTFAPSAKEIVCRNISKTLETVPNVTNIAFLVAIAVGAFNVWYGAMFVCIPVFVFFADRMFKNFLYSLMNIIGYRKLMTALYKCTNKLTKTIYGR